jgi:hypothetical protein
VVEHPVRPFREVAALFAAAVEVRTAHQGLEPMIVIQMAGRVDLGEVGDEVVVKVGEGPGVLEVVVEEEGEVSNHSPPADLQMILQGTKI